MYIGLEYLCFLKDTKYSHDRLLQQYTVDGYMAIEQDLGTSGEIKKLRSHLFGGLMDAIVCGDSDCSMVGKTIILPSSHIRGPRYRAQNY
ncbi:hypothetical protein H5410_022137 [Solanum commersonii]|uniref:Uncharacterized protein n=1 Tax=Solanum commersonii TaxID=4109 RepID=A0A9J5ZGA1_SOLCO|nr:hypothetical protein H5410_022137 [Solanum commersonii]